MFQDEYLASIEKTMAETKMKPPPKVLETMREIERLNRLEKETETEIQQLKASFLEFAEKNEGFTIAQINERQNELIEKLETIASYVDRKRDLAKELKNLFAAMLEAHQRKHPKKETSDVAPLAEPQPTAGTPVKNTRRWKQVTSRSVQKTDPISEDDEDEVSSAAADSEQMNISLDDEKPKRKRVSEMDGLVEAVPEVVEKKKEEKREEDDSKDRDEEGRFYCWCKLEQDDEMINCEFSKCPYEWFHFKCIGITEAPDGDWYCSDFCKAGGLQEKGVKENEAEKKPKRNSKGKGKCQRKSL